MATNYTVAQFKIHYNLDSTNAVTLDYNEYRMLSSLIPPLRFAAEDVVTVADRGFYLSGLDAAALQSFGVRKIDATDGSLNLSWAQLKAFTDRGISLVSDDDITLIDTSAKISASTEGDLANIDHITITGTSASLTLAQYTLLKAHGLVISKSQTVTISDTAANLQSADFAALKAAGVTGITLSDTSAKIKVLDDVALANIDHITLTDTAFSLTPTQYDLLTQHGWSGPDGQTFTLELAVAELNAYFYEAFRFPQSDYLALVDTAGSIQSLLNGDDDNFGYFQNTSFTAIKANDGGDITLTNLNSIKDLYCKIETEGVITVWLGSSDILELIENANFADLNSYGVTIIDATDDELDLTSDQYDTFNASGLLVQYNDVVTVEGQRVSTREIGYLTAVGVDKIDSTDTDNKLSLSFAQYNALGRVALTSGDNVTLLDTGDIISNLDSTVLNALAGKNIDAIDVSDNAMSLTVAQYKALFIDSIAAGFTRVKLTGADVITLKDTGTAINALTADQLAGLAANGVDFIDAYDSTAAVGSQNNLTLSVQQYLRLIATSTALTAGDVVTIKDTAAAIKGLTYAQIRELAANNVDFVDASDVDLELTVGDAKAFGTVKFGTTKDVIVRDDAAVITATSSADIQKLTDNGVDRFVPITNYLRLTVDQAKNLGSSVVDSNAEAIVLDSADNIQTLTDQQIAALARSGIDRIDVEDKLSTPDVVERNLSVSVDQYRALMLGGIKLTADDYVTLTDTTDKIQGLTDAELSALAGNLIDAIDVSGDGKLSLSVARYSSLKTVVLTTGDVVTLADTGDNIANLGATGIAALAGKFIDVIDVTGDGKLTLDIASYNALTNNAVDLTLAQYKGAIASVTFAADDKVSFENVRDFNHDGRSDVVLQNSVTGDVYLWNMDGKSLVSYGFFGWTPGSNWVAKATGDFDNNGYADVLLQNSIDGSCYIWEKAGPDTGSTVSNTLSGKGFVGWTPGADWKVVGSGDFNGDHTSDILLQNDIDGSCYVWEVDSKKPLEGANALKASGFVGWTPGSDWKAKGIGDFNGDGVSDILLQNAKNGDCFVWEVDGSKPLSGDGSIKESGYIGWKPGIDWQAKAVGDFNNDGKDDVLLQNAKDGACYIWELNGLNGLVDSGYVGWAPGVTWQVKSSGDFNGDGKSDVLLQNSVTNECYVWQLNGTGALVGAGYVGWDPSSEWHALV